MQIKPVIVTAGAIAAGNLASQFVGEAIGDRAARSPALSAVAFIGIVALTAITVLYVQKTFGA